METKAYSYIRFSTPEQSRGDSLTRQMEGTRRYCYERGLQLDESLTFGDLGVSAFRGKHAETGALGHFLELVNRGVIPAGSTLIVENLDRLSRQKPLIAFNLLTSIVNSGVRLVTLSNRMEYDAESLNENPGQLFMTIGEIIRANQESERKSQLLKSAWKTKRTNIGKKKLTGKCPSWLRLSKDLTKYIIIPERAKTIERIYRMKASGKGKTAIVRELNADPDCWKPERGGRNHTGGWRESYVQKILTSRATIGEFQPYRKDEDGKRQKEGEPIPDYFPQIIPRDLFLQVEEQTQRNRETNFGGKTGKARNLFTRVAVCGLCGAPMHFIDKGQSPKGGQYLHCDHSRRKIDDRCPARPVRYDEFEHLFFQNLEELNVSDLMPDRDEMTIQINDLERRITANKLQGKEAGRQAENLIDTISLTSDRNVRESLEKRLSGIFEEQEELKAENKQLQKEHDSLLIDQQEIKERIDQANEIYQLLENTTTEEQKIEIRLRLRMEIQRLISRIEIYPLQEDYKPTEEIEPGVIKIMNSRYLDHVRIRFQGSKSKRILLLKTFAVEV